MVWSNKVIGINIHDVVPVDRFETSVTSARKPPIVFMDHTDAVSYTNLDVYKRQSVWSAKSQNNNNQKWKIVTVNAPSFDANKTYEISSVSNSSFVLDAAANPPKIGANVSIWKKKNQANQKWYIQKDSQGYYTIRSAANKSFILDAAANPPRAGSNVSIWTSKNQANQKWIIEQLANGSYIIKSVGNSKLVLDATGATPKIGANVSVWTANGGNNQKWNIKPA